MEYTASILGAASILGVYSEYTGSMQGSAARVFTASIQGTWTTQRVNWEYTVSILGVYKDLQHTSIQRAYTEYTQNIQGTASIQGVYRDLQHARPLKLFCHLPCLVPCAAGQHWWSIQFTCAQGWRNVPKPPPKRCLRWSVARPVQWPNLFIVFLKLFIGKILKKILVIIQHWKKLPSEGRWYAPTCVYSWCYCSQKVATIFLL